MTLNWVNVSPIELSALLTQSFVLRHCFKAERSRVASSGKLPSVFVSNSIFAHLEIFWAHTFSF